MMLNTLKKAERLGRKKIIGRMFTGGSSSFTVFPLRVVFMPEEELSQVASVLISVSKSRFKHAVDRNRIKRQIREAYRLNKGIIVSELEKSNLKMAVAFIYISKELLDTSFIQARMQVALQRICEKMNKAEQK